MIPREKCLIFWRQCMFFVLFECTDGRQSRMNLQLRIAMPAPDSEGETARWDDPRVRWDMEGLFWDGLVPAAVRNGSTTMEPNTKPMNPAMQQDDKDAVTAILAMTDYTNLKPEFEKAVVYQKAADGTETGIRPALDAAEADYVLKQNALNDARDRMVALQWKQHEWVLGARDQVAAKFGKSSDQYAATGLKKKSEYKKGGPRGPRTAAKPGGGGT